MQKVYNGPKGWKYLSTTDLLYIGMIDFLHKENQQAIDFLTVKLFNIPLREYWQMKKSIKLQFKYKLSWLFKTNEIETWLISAIRVQRIKLFGPQNKLADLTADEFMYCEGCYERFLVDQNPAHLDTLFAILYRKKGFFTGKRASFDADKLKKHIARAARVRPYIKRAISLNYAGCRNLIIARHPHVWKLKNGEGEEKPNQPKFTSWAGIILDLSGDKFGTYTQTLKTNVWLLLADLDKKAKAIADMEAPKQ